MDAASPRGLGMAVRDSAVDGAVLRRLTGDVTDHLIPEISIDATFATRGFVNGRLPYAGPAQTRSEGRHPKTFTIPVVGSLESAS